MECKVNECVLECRAWGLKTAASTIMRGRLCSVDVITSVVIDIGNTITELCHARLFRIASDLLECQKALLEEFNRRAAGLSIPLI